MAPAHTHARAHTRTHTRARTHLERFPHGSHISAELVQLCIQLCVDGVYHGLGLAQPPQPRLVLGRSAAAALPSVEGWVRPVRPRSGVDRCHAHMQNNARWEAMPPQTMLACWQFPLTHLLQHKHPLTLQKGSIPGCPQPTRQQQLGVHDRDGLHASACVCVCGQQVRGLRAAHIPAASWARSSSSRAPPMRAARDKRRWPSRQAYNHGWRNQLETKAAMSGCQGIYAPAACAPCHGSRRSRCPAARCRTCRR